MRTATVRRTVAAALVAGALGTAAGTAQAASQVDDFTGGTHDKTAVVGGGVEIAPAFKTAFEGPALPAGWMSGNWATTTGSATANNGLTLSEAWARNDAPTGPGSSLQFRATFSSQAGQHVGFGVDYNNGPWAILSTSGPSDGVWARINTGLTGMDTATEIRVGDTATSYDFRIDWTTSNEFVFYVNNVEKARHPGAGMPLTVKSLASDFSPDPVGGPNTALIVASMSLRNVSQGTFTSKVFDAGSAAVTAIQFTKTTAAGLTYETSTSNDNSTWTAWSAGAIQPARYFKYRAVLSTTDVAGSPRLTAATVDFTIANTNPGGGTTPPIGDTKKAKIAMPRDADVTKRGKVRMLLSCPDDETRCSVALKFTSGGKTVASKSGKIDGGDSRYISLKLSKAAKKKLAKAGKLKVVATLTVKDAAGNKRTSSKRIWLYSL